MANLTKIDERISAAKRGVADLVADRKETFDAIDSVSDKIDALQAKDELTADEQKELDAAISKEASLKKASVESGDKIREAEATLSDLEKQRAERVEQNRVEASLREADRNVPAPAASPTSPAANVTVQEPTDAQKDHDIASFMRNTYIAKKNNLSLVAVCDGQAGDQYRNDRLSAAVTTSSDPSILPPNYRPRLVEFLRPATVVRQMQGLNQVPLPNGRMEMPRQNAAASASYSDELANITPSQPGTDKITLSSKKLTALIPASGEMVRHANPSTDAMLRNDMVRAVSTKEDVTFIRSDGTSNTPKGFLKYATDASNALLAVGTASVNDVTREIGKLILQVENQDVPMIAPYFLMAPTLERFLMDLRDGNGNYAFPEMQRGQLRGYPYLKTTQIPSNLTVDSVANTTELYFLDATEAIIGDTDTMEVNVSLEAAYHDGSNIRAAFSEDSVIYRIIVEHDTAMRHDEAVAVLRKIAWQNA